MSLTFPTDGSPHLRQPETQVAFKRAALENGVQICSLAIGNPGKSRLPFHTLQNVVMTPHMSGWTEGMIRRRQHTIADNINRLVRGEPLVNLLP